MMSEFVFVVRVTCLLTSIFLLITLKRQRYQLVKPSFIFLVFFNLQIQWGAAIQAVWIESTLVNPWHYYYLAFLLPFAVLTLTRFTFRREAKSVLRRAAGKKITLKNTKPIVFFLTMAIVAITMSYLVIIPLGKTGLYAAFFNPEAYIEMRQKGMQEIDNIGLRYGFALLSTVLAPMLAVLLWLKLTSTHRLFYKVRFAFVVLLLLIAVSLYGARGPAVIVLLVLLYALFLRSRFPIDPIKIGLAIGLVLCVPSLIVWAFRGEGMSLAMFIEAYISILDRVFGRNIVAGVWTIDYAQKVGYFGIAGISKLAALLGYEPVNAFNVIALYHRPDSFSTLSATSSFIFAYYSYFGLAAFLPCLFLTLLLDTMLLIYRKIPNYLLVPCLSAIAISVSKLCHTVYTTTLLTGGLLVIPLLGLFFAILNHIVRVAR